MILEKVSCNMQIRRQIPKIKLGCSLWDGRKTIEHGTKSCLKLKIGLKRPFDPDVTARRRDDEDTQPAADVGVVCVLTSNLVTYVLALRRWPASKLLKRLNTTTRFISSEPQREITQQASLSPLSLSLS